MRTGHANVPALAGAVRWADPPAVTSPWLRPALVSGVPDTWLCRVPIARLDQVDLPGVDTLSAAERRFVEAAKPRRAREVAAGRAALRAALRAAGWGGAGDLLPGEHGRPRLPDGFTGSITHKDGVALALAAPLRAGRTVGLDSEVVGRDRSDIARRILRPAEQDRWLATGGAWPQLLEVFSVKEAIYKALHPHVPRYIGFEEAEVHEDGTVQMHLVHGEGPFTLEATAWWESQRLISVVQARPA